MRISDWSSDVCSSDLLPPMYLRSDIPIQSFLTAHLRIANAKTKKSPKRKVECFPFALGVQQTPHPSKRTVKIRGTSCSGVFLPSRWQSFLIAPQDRKSVV